VLGVSNALSRLRCGSYTGSLALTRFAVPCGAADPLWGFRRLFIADRGVGWRKSQSAPLRLGPAE
jgi:hypothetical protein